MKILIIGDSCIDDFIYGDINRISPDAPIPVFYQVIIKKMMVKRMFLIMSNL